MTENIHKPEDDDQLKELFAQFKPEMSSGDDFARRLENRLAAIEDVKERLHMHCRRIKRAVSIAAFIGFAIGVALTLAFPMIMQGISALLSQLSPALTSASSTVSWTVISLGTIASAITAYDLSLSSVAHPNPTH